MLDKCKFSSYVQSNFENPEFVVDYAEEDNLQFKFIQNNIFIKQDQLIISVPEQASVVKVNPKG